uniref:hypothetical protein n=1 Tax=Thaumasiovibrio occultus TaxID=1891184 RepID=UPI000B35C490|nr:hypothetical protein [Thaumasiovibrio occultus]
MKTPTELQLDGITVATLVSYHYETPWASGKVEFLDASLLTTLAAVSNFATFDDEVSELELSEEEQDKRWSAKLDELAISLDDLALTRNGRWTITINEVNTPIFAVRFDANAWIDWRF